MIYNKLYKKHILGVLTYSLGLIGQNGALIHVHCDKMGQCMAFPLNYTFVVEGPLLALSFAEPNKQHNRPAIKFIIVQLSYQTSIIFRLNLSARLMA